MLLTTGIRSHSTSTAGEGGHRLGLDALAASTTSGAPSQVAASATPRTRSQHGPRWRSESPHIGARYGR